MTKKFKIGDFVRVNKKGQYYCGWVGEIVKMESFGQFYYMKTFDPMPWTMCLEMEKYTKISTKLAMLKKLENS